VRGSEAGGFEPMVGLPPECFRGRLLLGLAFCIDRFGGVFRLYEDQDSGRLSLDGATMSPIQTTFTTGSSSLGRGPVAAAARAEARYDGRQRVQREK